MKGKISMPTPEERLGTIEREFWQFKADTKEAYEEMALEVTMLKGLSEDSIKRLISLRRVVDQRFDNVDQRLSGMDQRLSGVEQRLETLEHDISDVKGLLGQILERLSTFR
ncbi:MAG: hypothetical protein NVS4B1_13820 [Ktedonobacteraceae bacterium]